MVSESPLPDGSTQLTFKKGQTIYEQDSKSDGVYLILDGEVDILRVVDEVFHHIATFDDGCIFGESSVIRRAARSATARARTEVKVLFIEADPFRKSIADPLTNLVFRSMADRLAERYVPERELLETPESFKASRIKREKRKKHTGVPVIEGVTPLVQEKLLGKVSVKQFPFIVGNSRVYGELAKLSDQNLMMPLPMAPDLDSQHFELLKRGEEVFIRDLGSPNGTVVNGTLIRHNSKQNEVMLDAGENVVGTGGARSKVTFLISLQEI